MKHILKSILRRFGHDIVKYKDPRLRALEGLPRLTAEENAIIARVVPYTMTNNERLGTLIDAIKYITANQIPGDIVECGVYRGGSMMTVALMLMACGDVSRSLYLYDTFEGMSAPTEVDKSPDGVPASTQLQQADLSEEIWCYATLEEVRENIYSTGYPQDKIHFIKGKVEDTIPGTLPSGLALLRLDTDWYESTRHELIHLYPLLHKKGALILDDYDDWKGAKKAVDEYILQQKLPLYLHRIHLGGRIVVGV